jgi:CheY-like chemotaxis protein
MSLENKTILVVEDDIELQEGIKFYLEFENYKVLIANNGLEALKILETAPLPNLILLDMKMPVMDGWEFATAFHKIYKKGPPILVMTAAPNAEERAREVKSDDWVPKPFSLDILLSKIKKLENSFVGN